MISLLFFYKPRLFTIKHIEEVCGLTYEFIAYPDSVLDLLCGDDDTVDEGQ